MTQIEMPLARRSDVQTSHDAAFNATSFAASHEAVIYAALAQGDLTAKEIAEVTRLDSVQVSRRLKPMMERGLIQRTTLVRAGCTVWHRR